jgi:hypothetical protein
MCDDEKASKRDTCANAIVVLFPSFDFEPKKGAEQPMGLDVELPEAGS